jgi:murein L,D-transpeptidase YafK
MYPVTEPIMNYLPLMFTLLFLSATTFAQSDFKTRQLTFSRVKEAYQEKEASVKKLFASKNVDITKTNLFFRAFKQEKIFEVWATPVNSTTYQLITTYQICAVSGTLGPKRVEGDYQVPEGFYYIDRFNPQSNFHLSLGINYPNASDKILGQHGKLGGDIFIHGGCVTVGCLPMTDDLIKELYVMAVEAKSYGQKQIPLHIFPAKLNEENMASLLQNFALDIKMHAFWSELKKGYDLFEKNKQLPAISITPRGMYAYK